MHIATRILSIAVMLALVFGGFTAVPAAPSVPWQSKVDPWVLQTAAEGQTEFLAFLTEQADLSPAAGLATRLEKGTFVFETLTEVANRTQPAVIADLKARGVPYRPFWVANMIWVRGGPGVVQALAERSDIAHIYANPKVKLELPEVAPGGDATASPDTIEWNISKVNADDVWAQGFTGQGAVVAGQDTGYDWNHPALINQYRGWDGGSADHNYNWHDAIHSGGGSCGHDSQEPCDDSQHGTHTMGTIVGDDGGANQIGMAPGARWIGCRNMDQGVGTPDTYAECYQWFIAPTDLNDQNPDPSKAPDAINNSWGCPLSEGCTDPNVLLTVVNNVRSAGILTNHSAGNEGSACSTVSTPAAIYDASFTVGATDSSDNIASYSSRGPVTVDGSGRMKPDISAPGSNIRSSVPGGGYQGGWSGTSMAGPHVTGLVALLISASPILANQVDSLESVIEQTAVPRTTNQGCGGDGNNDVPNNVYGWGRIDALAAFNEAYYGFNLNNTASSAEILPSQTITYTIDLTFLQPNGNAATNVVLTDTLPVGTSFVSATGDYTLDGSTVQWDFASMAANETQTVELVVQAEPTARGEVVNDDYGARSNEILTVLGAPVTTSISSSALGLVKTASLAVLPGDLLTYTLTVSNPYTTIPVNNVVVTDVLPANTTFVTATLPYLMLGDTIAWEIPSLAPAAAQTFELVVQAPVSGTITNSEYGARSDEADPAHGEPVDTLVMPYMLELAKTAPESVAIGDVLTYTLTVTNPHLTAVTHNLVLTDVLPTSTTFITATQPYTLSGDLVTWTAPSLPPGGVWAVQLAVRVPVTFTGSVVNESYAVQSDEVEAVAGLPVVTNINALELQKTASTDLASHGDWITYTLTVTNLHPLSATHNVVLSDTLPLGTAFITATQPYSATGDTISWTAPSLDPGASWTVKLTVQVLPEVSGSVVNDKYAVFSDEVITPIFGAPVVTRLKSYVYLPAIYNGAGTD